MRISIETADGKDQFLARQRDCLALKIEVEAEGETSVQAAFSSFYCGGQELSAAHCCVLNTQRVDAQGRESLSWTRCPGRAVLWGYLDIPPETAPGRYTGTLTVRDADGNEETAGLSVAVAEGAEGETNLDDPASFARIKWFQSRAWQEGPPPRPYLPAELRGETARVLGRDIRFGAFGLPEAIGSWFTQSVQLGETRREVLGQGFRFTAEGQELSEQERSIREENGTVRVWSRGESADFTLEGRGVLDFDGTYSYTLTLSAKRRLPAAGFKLECALASPRFFMGLGQPGGKYPESLDFTWNPAVNQDGFWAGDTGGGMKLRLRDAEYKKPNVNIYYGYKPITVPKSWSNERRGGIRIEGGRIQCLTGERSLAEGETLNFGFDLWITPFKPLDSKEHFTNRYYHTYRCKSPEAWLEELKRSGANVINIHHGTDLNPYINYPFYETAALKEFADRAHEAGGRVKLYDTIRELSTKCVEFPVLRSLGYEVLEPSAGIQGATLWQEDARQWIVQHYGDDIIPAWRQEITTGKYAGEVDASILTNGQSRLCNYYIEGLQWLVEHTGIDGLYLDDVAFDRTTMKRAARLLDQREGSLIDLHSWNHMNERAGMTSSAYQYMELLPYISRAWLGEGFNYETASPDYWLVELSGIPYGVMGEMLQGGGNFYRGMVFGETNRLGWSGESPEPLWELWDRFGIAESRMIGWWDEACPVRTSDPDVLATCYLRDGRALVAMASWAEEEREVALLCDSGLGFEPGKILTPGIAGHQEEAEAGTGQTFRIPPRSGLLALVLEGAETA